MSGSALVVQDDGRSTMVAWHKAGYSDPPPHDRFTAAKLGPQPKPVHGRERVEGFIAGRRRELQAGIDRALDETQNALVAVQAAQDLRVKHPHSKELRAAWQEAIQHAEGLEHDLALARQLLVDYDALIAQHADTTVVELSVLDVQQSDDAILAQAAPVIAGALAAAGVVAKAARELQAIALEGDRARAKAQSLSAKLEIGIGSSRVAHDTLKNLLRAAIRDAFRREGFSAEEIVALVR